MADPMVIMLPIAVISAVAGAYTGEGGIADVAIILFVVVVNSVLGVVQEGRRRLLLCKKMSAATSKVIRDGRLDEVASTDLVAGDIVLPEAETPFRQIRVLERFYEN